MALRSWGCWRHLIWWGRILQQDWWVMTLSHRVGNMGRTKSSPIHITLEGAFLILFSIICLCTMPCALFNTLHCTVQCALCTPWIYEKQYIVHAPMALCSGTPPWSRLWRQWKPVLNRFYTSLPPSKTNCTVPIRVFLILNLFEKLLYKFLHHSFLVYIAQSSSHIFVVFTS